MTVQLRVDHTPYPKRITGEKQRVTYAFNDCPPSTDVDVYTSQNLPIQKGANSWVWGPLRENVTLRQIEQEIFRREFVGDDCPRTMYDVLRSTGARTIAKIENFFPNVPKGYGHEALQAVLRDIREQTIDVVWVQTDKIRMQTLLERAGFRTYIDWPIQPWGDAMNATYLKVLRENISESTGWRERIAKLFNKN